MLQNSVAQTISLGRLVGTLAPLLPPGDARQTIMWESIQTIQLFVLDSVDRKHQSYP